MRGEKKCLCGSQDVRASASAGVQTWVTSQSRQHMTRCLREGGSDSSAWENGNTTYKEMVESKY
jgi:hypothetical protein